jgi:hypothetical protein
MDLMTRQTRQWNTLLMSGFFQIKNGIPPSLRREREGILSILRTRNQMDLNEQIEEPKRIIHVEFRERERYGLKRDCPHLSVIIRESLWRLECADCGEMLDPIAYLVDIAKSEQRVEYRVNELRERGKVLTERLKTQNRTKCEHCGQMTRIRK